MHSRRLLTTIVTLVCLVLLIVPSVVLASPRNPNGKDDDKVRNVTEKVATRVAERLENGHKNGNDDRVAKGHVKKTPEATATPTATATATVPPDHTATATATAPPAHTATATATAAPPTHTVAATATATTVPPSHTPAPTATQTPTDTSGANPLVFATEADAYVEENSPNKNFGSEDVLLVDGSPNRVGYLRFVVTGVNGAVQSAKLRLFAVDPTADGPAVHLTSNEWSEDGITWTNKPAPNGAPSDDKGEIAADNWVEFDVTPLVKGNGTYSFVLVPQSGNGVDFETRTSSRSPQLHLTLGASARPGNPTATPTSVATPTSTVVPTSTATPTTAVPTASATPTAAAPTTTATATPTASAPVSGVAQVSATRETQPVPHSGDAADDVAIWIHPTDPSQSTVIGTDKDGGLAVYDLSGKQLYYYDGATNNVDLQYNFPLAGTPVALVAATNISSDKVDLYRVNVSDRSLVKIGAVGGSLAAEPGIALYRSPTSGKFYAFVSAGGDGEVAQIELDGSSGQVVGTVVRRFDVGSQIEGMVADDEHAQFYVGEENVGVWRYNAEPNGGSSRTKVEGTTSSGGRITPDVEGLAIYPTTNGGGYLLASNQGANTFLVYDRVTNAYRGSFRIVSGNNVDGVSDTDGIDVTNFGLGSAFPQGVFVAQDGTNDSGNQNFKLVPWQAIANALGLTIDTSWDPRQAGNVGGSPSPTSTPQPTRTAQPTQAPTATPTVRLPTATATPTTAAQTPTATPTPTSTPSSGGSVTCNHTVGLDVKTVDGSGNYAAIKPGDTVCIQAGNRGELEIRNISGQSGKPVTFVNYGGVVNINNGGYAGIHIRNSKYFRLLGNGVSSQCGAFIAPANQQCGFRIKGNSGRGVSAVERSTNFEIGYVEVYSSGETAFTSQTKDVSRSQFTQYDSRLHHFYVHDVPNDEGVYYGSSYWPSSDDPELHGVEISYGLVDTTGRDGIQVGSARSNCFIHHNQIFRSSQLADASHDGGIINNKGSRCTIYDNYIEDAGENGIKLYGDGSLKVYNNVIVRPGRKASGNKGSGIVMNFSHSTDEKIDVLNNTIVSPNGSGIVNATGTSGHRIQNNLVTGAASTAISGGSATVSHNLTSGDPKFVNPSGRDYSLQPSSPAIDVGTDLSSAGITTDFMGRTRPAGSGFDVGAFEYYPH